MEEAKKKATNPPLQTPPSVEPNREINNNKSREVGKEVNREGSREVGKEVNSGLQSTSTIFDPNVKPYRKDSFLFTDDEFEAMEDMKLELRRKFDLKTSKTELARCAIGHLVEDYKRNGPNSIVIKRLKVGK